MVSSRNFFSCYFRWTCFSHFINFRPRYKYPDTLRYLEDFEIFRKTLLYLEFCYEKKIQTNLHIWACCNPAIYSIYIIYAMWLMSNKMADNVRSEPRTNHTVVSLLDHFRPPEPNNGLSRSLPVLKCRALVFLLAERYFK